MASALDAAPFLSLLKESANLSQQSRATWADVGITEFVADGRPVAAFIKQRFSDFIVNEIDMDHTVVRLATCSNPNTAGAENDTAEERLSDQDILVRLKDLVGDFDAFAEFLATDDEREFALGDVPDKLTRSTIHHLLKQYGRVGLFSQTFCDGDRKLIKVSKGRPPSGNQFQNSIHKFAGGDCHYLQVAMYKENVETLKAVNALSQITRIPVGRFSYAGNKDRRGITTQLVTAFKLDAAHLLNALPRLRPDVRVGNLMYVQDALKLGSLSGNRFGVVLRDLHYPDGTLGDDDVRLALATTSARGFVNYFGLQRFGTGAISTHRIGQAILQNRFDLAVALILTPQPTQSDELRAALVYLAESGDVNGTLACLGARDFIERSVLQYLCRFPSNYANALDRLPRNMKVLYVHAYQSWIWNLMASHRLRNLDGDRAEVGDLVLDKSECANPTVIVLDESNASKYSIFDVVLPLPGYAITLPSNDVGRYCRDLLTSHQLSLELLDHRVRDYKLTGAYRPIVVKPDDMQWDFFRYSDPTIPLLQSDADLINGVEAPTSVPDGDKAALRLQFSLPASVYATMLIREVLKREPMNWFAENAIDDGAAVHEAERVVDNELMIDIS